MRESHSKSLTSRRPSFGNTAGSYIGEDKHGRIRDLPTRADVDKLNANDSRKREPEPHFPNSPSKYASSILAGARKGWGTSPIGARTTRCSAISVRR